MLPAYKISLSDNTSYVTSMSKTTTLEIAKQYFLGTVQTTENLETGEETHRMVTKVEEINTKGDIKP